MVRLDPVLVKLEGMARESVADLLIGARVSPRLKGNAQLAEFVLVPLEHPLERIESLRISGYRIADLARCQVPARRQQADHQAEQTLGFLPRHRHSSPATCPRSTITPVAGDSADCDRFGALACHSDQVAARRGSGGTARVGGGRGTWGGGPRCDGPPPPPPAGDRAAPTRRR